MTIVNFLALKCIAIILLNLQYFTIFIIIISLQCVPLLMNMRITCSIVTYLLLKSKTVMMRLSMRFTPFVGARLHSVPTKNERQMDNITFRNVLKVRLSVEFCYRPVVCKCKRRCAIHSQHRISGFIFIVSHEDE